MRLWDASAIGLSAICALHCLALPVAAAALPSAAPMLAHDPSVHAVLFLIAAPVTAFAVWLGLRGRKPSAFIIALALAGLSLLLFGMSEPWAHAGEGRALTLAGIAVLALAHVLNWRRARLPA